MPYSSPLSQLGCGVGLRVAEEWGRPGLQSKVEAKQEGPGARGLHQIPGLPRPAQGEGWDLHRTRPAAPRQPHRRGSGAGGDGAGVSGGWGVLTILEVAGAVSGPVPAPRPGPLRTCRNGCNRGCRQGVLMGLCGSSPTCRPRPRG